MIPPEPAASVAPEGSNPPVRAAAGAATPLKVGRSAPMEEPRMLHVRWSAREAGEAGERFATARPNRKEATAGCSAHAAKVGLASWHRFPGGGCFFFHRPG